MDGDFSFRRTARQPESVAAVAVAVAVLIGLVFVLGAHPLISLVVAVLIAPALWDLAVNAEAELTLSHDRLSWRVGERAGDVPLNDIDEVRTRTAFDFSQRAKVLRNDGKRLYIPSPCLPPGRRFDEELTARGITVLRTLF